MQKMISPCALGPFSLRNPFVFLPFFMSFADENGLVTPALLHHYKKMAASGAGLVVVEAALIRNCAAPFSISAYAPEHLPGLSALAQTIQAGGAKAVLQICHPGRYSRMSGAPAPSVVPPFGNPEMNPRELTEKEILSIAEDFAESALIAKQSGFDGVELHGATGYLLASFVSPYTNRRNDEYGGSVENRLRFPVAVCKTVRERVEDFPVSYRFMAREYIEGGLSIEEGAIAASILEEALNPAYLSVTAGQYECFALLAGEKKKSPEGFMLEEAKAVKKAIGKTPVIAAGHMQSRQICERALSDGVDAIGLGRPLFADPDLLRKMTGEDAAPVRKCVQCNTCQKQAGMNRPVFCARWTKEEKEERLKGIPHARYM